MGNQLVLQLSRKFRRAAFQRIHIGLCAAIERFLGAARFVGQLRRGGVKPREGRGVMQLMRMKKFGLKPGLSMGGHNLHPLSLYCSFCNSAAVG